MLTKNFFINNRKKLRSLAGGELTVITANGLLQRSADTTFPFRQDSNFFYLTGLNEPDLILVIHEAEEFIILPKRSETEDIFGGSISKKELTQQSGITAIYSHAEGWCRYKILQQNFKKIHTLDQAPPKISGIDSFYTNPARRYLIQKLKRIHPSVTFEDLRSTLSQMRQVKQPDEIEAIKQAILITKSGFGAVQKIAKPGAYEYELEAEFDRIFKNNQAGHGYQPIIAGDERACILHYIKNNQKLKDGSLYLMDVGAENQNYSADITRTYGLNATQRQKDVSQAVKKVHLSAIDFLKSGVTWKEYILYVEKIMGEELIGLKLITDATRENIRKYFPHAVSHSLGLDVHDTCDYKVIYENMLITVEPGIYIPEEGIGVRIEDNILITKTGAVNLSSDIPY